MGLCLSTPSTTTTAETDIFPIAARPKAGVQPSEKGKVGGIPHTRTQLVREDSAAQADILAAVAARETVARVRWAQPLEQEQDAPAAASLAFSLRPTITSVVPDQKDMDAFKRLAGAFTGRPLPTPTSDPEPAGTVEPAAHTTWVGGDSELAPSGVDVVMGPPAVPTVSPEQSTEIKKEEATLAKLADALSKFTDEDGEFDAEIERNPLAPANLRRIASALYALTAAKGADLTQFSMPVRQLVPLSLLQVELTDHALANFDLLANLPSIACPVERGIAVLQHIVARLTTERTGGPVKMNKPLNPVLGEITLFTRTSPGGGVYAGIKEQVSHHPPITATYILFAGGVEYTAYMQVKPRFLGTRVETLITGRRVIRVTPPNGPVEEYSCTFPSLDWAFLPFPSKGLSSTAEPQHLICEATGFEAIITCLPESWFSFVRKSRIGGTVSLHGAPLALLKGSVKEGGKDVVLKPLPKSAATAAPEALTTPRVLVRSSAIAWVEDPAAHARLPPAPELIQLESVDGGVTSAATWAPVTAALASGEWKAAAKAKRAIEEAERAKRRDRSAAGTAWVPSYFGLDAATGVWAPNARARAEVEKMLAAVGAGRG